jgi:hypothetical protein
MALCQEHNRAGTLRMQFMGVYKEPAEDESCCYAEAWKLFQPTQHVNVVIISSNVAPQYQDDAPLDDASTVTLASALKWDRWEYENNARTFSLVL